MASQQFHATLLYEVTKGPGKPEASQIYLFTPKVVEEALAALSRALAEATPDSVVSCEVMRDLRTLAPYIEVRSTNAR